MPTRNPIRAHFTVAGQKLPVSHFSLLEAISRPTELAVNLNLNRPVDQAIWLGQAVHLQIEDDKGNSRQWHLRCEAATVEQAGQCGYNAMLTCRSAWGACFYIEPTQRVFCQANLPELVNTIFKDHALPFEYAQWHLSHEAWQREQIVQCAENDGEFIQRICSRENMQWFSRHDDAQETLHFIDHPRFLTTREKPLIYYPRNLFQDWPGSRLGVFELEYIQRAVLQAHDYLNDTPMRLYSGIPCMEAGVTTEGMPVKSYQRLSYEPAQLKTAVQARQIKTRDLPESGYRALKLQSNLLDLAPGTLVDVAGQSAHINYVLHSARVTDGGELLLYQNNVILQDAQSPWRGILNKLPAIPLVFQAKIESAHDLTYLNINGRETVRSMLDSHPSKNIHASIPIPRLTPFAHSSGGMQFPLYPGAEVLMTCLHGEVDLPVILGSVYNEDNPSPVNHLNPRINMIRTQQQQTVIFDDTPDQQLISLSTQLGHQWIMRHGDQPGIFVKCIGGLIISSQGRQAWHTGKNYSIWAGKTYTQRAMVSQNIKSAQGSILFKAKLDMKLHAQHQIELYAKRHATIFARQLMVKIKENQHILIEQGNALMTIQGAELIETEKNITISSVQGNLTLMNQAGNCGIELTQSGCIRLFGNQLLLNTELQKNAATINHR